MKRKGFTLVELLVVIAVIALLMGILMPALARVRQIAQRIMCGTNLSGIGKAMMVYANDYDDDLPRAGRRDAIWADSGSLGSTLQDWAAINWSTVFGNKFRIPVSCSLYLLVKYADVTVNQFVCNGDSGTEAFVLSDEAPFPSGTFDFPVQPDYPDVWDFGPEPGTFCSYSYHMPYQSKGTPIVDAEKAFAITATSGSKSPVCADRNPYMDMNAETYLNGIENTKVAPRWDPTDGYVDRDKTGNAFAHQRDGQNVMFVDSHVEFARYPNVGITNDNIYKAWSVLQPKPKGRELGDVSVPSLPFSDAVGPGMPADYKDALLVNEYQIY